MNTQTIIDDQISGQLEGRTDIRVECLDTSKVFNPKLYAQKKGKTTLHWIQFFGTHHISKAEYDEIIELSESDIFGNLTLKVDSEEEFKNKYSAKRPNVILEKVGVALFGKSWKKALADALSEIKSVDERRITHWLQCSRPIPKSVFNDLKVIKDKRLKEIQNIDKLLG
ncbi:hypothetical protein [Acinetobacter junii]|uniref:hypothetical protein n=1 Tax=Acinetobacter junii TaxID=40215 RepID=UPI002090B415|nr:hypothetical protein [Acinetobacter junii]USR72467.1 hypothetical protein NGM19_10620 [Acinetobacter junii]